MRKTKQKPKKKKKKKVCDLRVFVGTESASVFELFAGKDEALLVRRNALLVLNLLLHVLDGVAALHLQRDRLARQSLDEDLHSVQKNKEKKKIKKKKREHTKERRKVFLSHGTDRFVSRFVRCAPSKHPTNA